MMSSLLDPLWQQGVLSPEVAAPLSTLLACLLQFTDAARIVGRLYTGIDSLETANTSEVRVFPFLVDYSPIIKPPLEASPTC